MDGLARSQFAKSSCFRIKLFSTLSASLLYPEEYLLNTFSSEKLASDLTDLSNQLGVSYDPCSQNIAEGTAPAKQQEEIFVQLRQEYTRLFYTECLVMPYGSDYVSIYNKERIQVERVYKKSGLKKKDFFKEYPDHIACELDYLSYLSQMEYFAWSNDSSNSALEWQEECKDFWDFHVSMYIVEFAKSMGKSTRVEFYKNIAELLLKTATLTTLF